MPTIITFVPNEPEQRIEIVLDQETYVLRARWNTSDAAWYLDAWERDGKTPIAFGIKLVLGVMLGRTYRHPLFLAGMFLIADSNPGVEPGLADLGGRVILVHLNIGDGVLAGTTPL